MKRPGDMICLWIILAATAMQFHVSFGIVYVAAFIVGWFYNEQDRKRRDP